MNVTDALIGGARRFPAPFRAGLTLALNGFLPGFVTTLYSFRALRRALLADGVRILSAPYRLYVPDVDPLIRFYRDFEPVTSRALIGALTPGMTVLDVGANIGYVTLLAGRSLAGRGHVHAVEPSPDNLAFLTRNVRLSGLRNVSIHALAAGAAEEEKVLHINPAALTHGFYENPDHPTSRTINVKCVALDTLVPTRVDLVKIDVEGAELEVLAGMERILCENPAAILAVEWNPAVMRAAGRDPMALPAFLTEREFSVRVLDDFMRRQLSLESAVGYLHQGRLPAHWYGTLWARRRAG